MLENQQARESYIANIKQQLDDLADRIRRRLEAVTLPREATSLPKLAKKTTPTLRFQRI